MVSVRLLRRRRFAKNPVRLSEQARVPSERPAIELTPTLRSEIWTGERVLLAQPFVVVSLPPGCAGLQIRYLFMSSYQTIQEMAQKYGKLKGWRTS